MSNFNRRTTEEATKAISVRITESEHNQLKALTLLSEHRSIAEYIRNLVTADAVAKNIQQ